MRDGTAGRRAAALTLSVAVLAVIAVVAIIAGGATARDLAIGLPAAGAFITLVIGAGWPRAER